MCKFELLDGHLKILDANLFKQIINPLHSKMNKTVLHSTSTQKF